MLLYFVNGVVSQGIVNAELLVAHTHLPMVASAWTEPSHLLVTDAEGEFIADSGAQLASETTGKVTSMAWHPTHPVLAIGWSSGRLMLWTLPPMTKTAGTVSTPTEAPVEAEKALLQHDEGSVTTCVWSSGGTYLLTASSKMLVVAWMVEHTTVNTEKSDRDDVGKTMHFKATAMWSVSTEVVIVQSLHAAASVVPSLQNALKRQHQQSNTDAPDEFSTSRKLSFHRDLDDENDECTFFLASASDKQIFAVTEEQKLFPLLSLEEPPTAMLYEPAERQLVAFSVANVINVYHVSEDFTAKLILRRKLSTPSPNLIAERFTVTMRWATPGVLAFGCGDNRVRFFDIRGDRVYVVSHPVSEAAHITHIDTLEKKGLLVMATMEGPLAVFQRNVASHRDRGPVTIPGANTGDATMGSHGANGAAIPDGNDPAEEWELLTVVDVSGRVNRVSFTTAGHIVVALAKGRCRFFVKRCASVHGTGSWPPRRFQWIWSW
ncbi:hypothetical protein TRSC58_03275 [Trypanosoma rangeli SC58]|uniref:IFT140 first beta-propeller domain-containing protein n=1 Tax=Trypanosoma rangeli SC58 TaxID=429131 RepID=A0A061J6T3_TRYRA|nr:hypothetical protein TRSC58_03275 [Trypanosoma rangeli SC58]